MVDRVARPGQPAPTRTPRSLLDLRIGPIDLIAPFGLTLLLFAGYVKATPIVISLQGERPIDLTVLGASLVTAVVCVDLIRRRLIVPGGVWPVLALWAAFLTGLLCPAGTPYSADKPLRLFTLTLLSAIAPVFLLGTRLRQGLWLGTLVLAGLTVMILAVVSPDSVVTASDRLAAAGSNTIAAGRSFGVALVILCVLAAVRVVPWPLALPGIALFGWGTVYAGSRGPLLAALVALVVVATLLAADGWKRAQRLLGVPVVLGAGLALLGWFEGNSFAFQRATGLLGADDLSARARLSFYQESLRLIPEHPLGVGWGNFVLSLPHEYQVAFSGIRLYPHNVVLEVAVEAGWLAAAGLLAFMILGIRRLIRACDRRIGAPCAGVAVFFTVNAMVSGDVNDNRAMFAAISLGWAVAGGTSAAAGRSHWARWLSRPAATADGHGPQGGGDTVAAGGRAYGRGRAGTAGSMAVVTVVAVVAALAGVPPAQQFRAEP